MLEFASNVFGLTQAALFMSAGDVLIYSKVLAGESADKEFFDRIAIAIMKFSTTRGASHYSRQRREALATMKFDFFQANLGRFRFV